MLAEQAPHLSDKARELLNFSDEARIEQIRKNHWIGYARANKVLQRLEELRRYPPQERMPFLLLTGGSDYGKSAIVDRYAEQHQPRPSPDGNFAYRPVIKIDSPDKADEKRLFHKVLRKLNLPAKRSERPYELEDRFYASLRNTRTRLLIIDNLHDAIGRSTQAEVDFMKTIRKISTELQMAIAVTGLEEVEEAIKSDLQLWNRFHFKIKLEAFDIYDENVDDLAEYAEILATLEALYPLRKPSNLSEMDMIAKIHEMSKGILGETVKLLKLAGAFAIESGTEQITTDLLDEVDYQFPSS